MEDWVKLGKGIGNLQALKELRIVSIPVSDDEDPSVCDKGVFPGFDYFARVLRHVRQKITLSVKIVGTTLLSAEGFVRAIRGHPTIRRFEADTSFDDRSLGLLLTALATLPALESIDFDDEFFDAFIDNGDPENPEYLTTLLLSRSLRFVAISDEVITNECCQAVANALMSGSPVTHLYLGICQPEYDRPGFSIVRALQLNSTLKNSSCKLRVGSKERSMSRWRLFSSSTLL
jgi:hypothetical protein